MRWEHWRVLTIKEWGKQDREEEEAKQVLWMSHAWLLQPDPTGELWSISYTSELSRHIPASIPGKEGGFSYVSNDKLQPRREGKFPQEAPAA